MQSRSWCQRPRLALSSHPLRLWLMIRLPRVWPEQAQVSQQLLCPRLVLGLWYVSPGQA